MPTKCRRECALIAVVAQGSLFDGRLCQNELGLSALYAQVRGVGRVLLVNYSVVAGPSVFTLAHSSGHHGSGVPTVRREEVTPLPLLHA